MKRNTIPHPPSTLFFFQNIAPSSSPARKNAHAKKTYIQIRPTMDCFKSPPANKNSYQLLPSCDPLNKAFILRLDVCLGVSTWHISILTHRNSWRRLAMVARAKILIKIKGFINFTEASTTYPRMSMNSCVMIVRSHPKNVSVFSG